MPNELPKGPRLRDGVGSAGDSTNNQIWDAYYNAYQEDSVVPGSKYPNEHLVRFMAGLSQGQHAENLSALEVGFGPVTNMLMMRKFGFHVQGIEVSNSAVERGRAAIHRMGLDDEIHLSKFNGEEIPVATQSIDLLVALQSIYYNLNQNFIAEECARVLKPGGKIFLSFFTPRHDYMKYIDGEPGGVVRFNDQHPNDRLRSLHLFLYKSVEGFIANYGRFFDLNIGLLEDETFPMFQSWWYVTGQLKGLDDPAKPVKGRATASVPNQISSHEPIDLMVFEQQNAAIWERKYAVAYQNDKSSGSHYPSETLIRFLATRKRRTLETFFSNVGAEDQTLGAGDAVLELMPLNTVNLHMIAERNHKACGLSWSPIVIDAGREILEKAGIDNGITLEQLVPGNVLPFANHTFQLVISDKFGSHMPDQSRLAKEIARITTPDAEIMIGYLSPRHGYLQWCESLGGDYYRISDAHPDPTMHGLILFVGERQALKQIWSAYFDVEVVRVEFDMHRYFSSFYYVRGRKRA